METKLLMLLLVRSKRSDCKLRPNHWYWPRIWYLLIQLSWEVWSARCSASDGQAGYAAPDTTCYLDHFVTSTSFWNCKQAQVTRQWSLTLNDQGPAAKMHLLALCKVRCALRCEKSAKILPCILLSEKHCIRTWQWALARVNKTLWKFIVLAQCFCKTYADCWCFFLTHPNKAIGS